MSCTRVCGGPVVARAFWAVPSSSSSVRHTVVGARARRVECDGARRASIAVSRNPRRAMIHFALLFSKQGKIRLSKYYVVTSQKDRKRIERDAVNAIIPRPAKACNVVEYKDMKLIYRKYASLYFCLAVDREANELATLEQIQHYVEILDKYFGNVCELDLVFNFHKAHYVLDEVFIAGHLQETSKKLIARLVGEHDALVESAKFGGLAGEDS